MSAAEIGSSGAVKDLSDRVKLAVTGGDRVRYLNGQVTSNVGRLLPGATQPACITTAKGKLCAEVMITAQPDRLLIDADCSLRDSLQARLERYIVADDVVIEEVALPLFHFLGPPPALAGLSPSRRIGIDGWDLWAQADVDRPLIDEALWQALRIEHGVPRWGAELTEDTLPPEASLELTHIDYHKGCYIGQEVISRLKSVGHVNRQLCGFASPLPENPFQVGAPVFSKHAPERAVGIITSATWSFALEKPIALGYLKRGTAPDGLFTRWPDATEHDILKHDLPFVS